MYDGMTPREILRERERTLATLKDSLRRTRFLGTKERTLERIAKVIRQIAAIKLIVALAETEPLNGKDETS